MRRYKTPEQLKAWRAEMDRKKPKPLGVWGLTGETVWSWERLAELQGSLIGGGRVGFWSPNLEIRS